MFILLATNINKMDECCHKMRTIGKALQNMILMQYINSYQTLFKFSFMGVYKQIVSVFCIGIIMSLLIIFSTISAGGEAFWTREWSQIKFVYQTYFVINFENFTKSTSFIISISFRTLRCLGDIPTEISLTDMRVQQLYTGSHASVLNCCKVKRYFSSELLSHKVTVPFYVVSIRTVIVARSVGDPVMTICISASMSAKETNVDSGRKKNKLITLETNVL